MTAVIRNFQNIFPTEFRKSSRQTFLEIARYDDLDQSPATD